MNAIIKSLMVFLLSLFVLAACGGGGDDPPPQQPPQGSSNWDTMVWDQDNWS